ncbi:hypothetical protein [Portibacter lacus]|uniref:Uncharacterized protein n=1 Tax=Portibacter lacus TaxID=1099794 RepID=A0AA37WDH1_9BACT|nr:hypothetical protein [Portibacter lacus]GLR17876.1 hypothetical protein GCM10007940_24910 [Portibacter lacus]
MNILKGVFVLIVMFIFYLPVSANVGVCAEGLSQGKGTIHWDPINGEAEFCPHDDALVWCCYDPC